MKNKIINYSIVIIFILVLYAPFIVFQFVKDKLPDDNFENRVLAVFPELNLSDKKSIKNFPAGFDNYWNDNLPFRNILKQTHEVIDFYLFDISSSSRVIVGKNDGNKKHTWLFYNDVSDGDPIGDIRGTKLITEEELNKYYNVLKNNTEIMNNKGIDVYYVVAPNKSTIYSEYLPNTLNIVNEKSRNDILYDYLKEKNVGNYIFLKDILKNSKDNRLLYHMLDTHWNAYGAFIGSREVLKKINNDFTYYDSVNIESTDYEEANGDLKTFINIPISLEQPTLSVTTDYEGRYKIISEESINNGEVVITSNDNPVYDETVMLIGDSFRKAMIPYFANMYRKCIFLHRSSYSEELLINSKPNIIIFEAVERYYSSNFDLVFNS